MFSCLGGTLMSADVILLSIKNNNNQCNFLTSNLVSTTLLIDVGEYVLLLLLSASANWFDECRQGNSSLMPLSKGVAGAELYGGFSGTLVHLPFLAVVGKQTPEESDVDDDAVDTTSFGCENWIVGFIFEFGSGDGGGALTLTASVEKLSFRSIVSSVPKNSSKTMRRRLIAAATTAALQQSHCNKE